MSAKADDAALLTQGKEDNAGRRKIDRKDEQVFKLSDYKYNLYGPAPRISRAAAQAVALGGGTVRRTFPKALKKHSKGEHFMQAIKNFSQKHKHAFIMAALVCAVLLVFGAVRIFALPGLSNKVQTTKFNTVTDAFTPALQSGESVAQSIKTDRALYTAAVLPDMRACKSGASLQAVLSDETGAVLARAEAEAAYSDSEEPPYVALVFDTPVPGGVPRTLTLTVTVQPRESGDTVRFYKSANAQPQTGMGTLLENGKESKGSLTLLAETDYARGFITPFFVVLTLLCAGALCAVYAAAFILRWPLHKVYLTALLSFGVLYMMVIPPYGVTDEAQHISQAYNNSARVLGVTPEYIAWGNSYRRACDTNSTLEENATTVFSYKAMTEGLLRGTPEPAGSTTVYSREEVGGYQVPYVVSTLGVLVARLLHFGYVPTLLLGRLFNFALFAAFTYLAVKHAPFGNSIFAVVGLLPGTLHVAASFSRDSFTLAVAFLFTALALRAAHRTGCIGWREAAVLGVLCAVLAPCKAAYVPLVLLLLLLPAARFAKLWQAWAYRASVLGAAVLLYWRANVVIVYDAAVKSTENYEAAVAVNPDSITYTLPYILTHVWQTLGLLVNTIVENGAHYLNGIVGGTLGNNNLALSWAFVAALFVVLAFAMQQTQGHGALHPRAWRASVPAWLGVLGCCALVVVGCVLWTPTRYTTVYGLQGRYFLPMLPLLLLLCKPGRPVRKAAEGQAAAVEGAADKTENSACALLPAMAAVQLCIVLNIFYVVAQR